MMGAPTGMMGASMGMMGAPTGIMGTLGVSGREPISKQIQSDWANREYVEVITSSIKKMTDFLSSFDQSCRGKIALINERLTKLERSVDWLEATVNREGNVGTP